MSGCHHDDEPVEGDDPAAAAARGGGSLDESHIGLTVADAGRHVRAAVGPPANTSFTAYAISATGQQELAATWSSTPTGRALVTGATSIPRDRLVRVEVVTATDRVVLSASG